MSASETEAIPSLEPNHSDVSRRSFLKAAAFTGAALGGLAISAQAAQSEHENDQDSMKSEHEHLKKDDRDILIAAEIAEALAVTTYTNIINIAPFFQSLESDDQGYLVAARQEEMSHYLLEQSVTGQPSPFTNFFFLKTCSPVPRPLSTRWSHSKTPSSRPISLVCATSPHEIFVSPLPVSWASKAITAPSPAS